MSAVRRLWPLAGAELTLDRALVAEGATGAVTLPVPVFLIEHDRGLVLFDTGIAPAAWEDARGVFGSLLDMFELHCEPQHRLDVQLSRVGYSSDDVSHAVLAQPLRSPAASACSDKHGCTSRRRTCSSCTSRTTRVPGCSAKTSRAYRAARCTCGRQTTATQHASFDLMVAHSARFEEPWVIAWSIEHDALVEDLRVA